MLTKNRLLIPFLLLSIFVLAAAPRISKLGQVPDGFYVDEAAVGFNAYTIARAGVDQYGVRFPVFFRALDDYKNSIYIYTTALLLLFLDLDEVSTRLPAVIFGLLTIFVAFFLGKETYRSDAAGLWTAFFVAVSPWHFQYSRIAWQAITLTVFYPLSIVFIMRWLKDFSLPNAVLAGLFLGFSLYTYTTAKVLVLVTVMFLTIYLVLSRRWKPSIGFFYCALLLMSSLYIYHYWINMDYINLRLRTLMLSLSEMPQAYFAHLHPKFLFFSGDANLRHSPGRGVLCWYTAPFLIAGIYDAWRRPARNKFIILMMCLFVPVLGALAKEYPHATRTISWIPFIFVLGSGGLLFLLERIKLKWQPVFVGCMILAILATYAEFLHHYFKTYSKISKTAWESEFIPAVRQAQRFRMDKEPVRVFGGSYIEWMFAEKTDPELILEHKEQIDLNRTIYDGMDLRNKYSFLYERLIPGFKHSPGLYIVHKHYFPRDLFNSGRVTFLYQNDLYVVFRIGQVSRK